MTGSPVPRGGSAGRESGSQENHEASIQGARSLSDAPPRRAHLEEDVVPARQPPFWRSRAGDQRDRTTRGGCGNGEIGASSPCKETS